MSQYRNVSGNLGINWVNCVRLIWLIFSFLFYSFHLEQSTMFSDIKFVWHSWKFIGFRAPRKEKSATNARSKITFLLFFYFCESFSVEIVVVAGGSFPNSILLICSTRNTREHIQNTTSPYTRTTINRTNASGHWVKKRIINNSNFVRDLIFYYFRFLLLLYSNVQNRNVQQQSTNHSWITLMFWVASGVRYGLRYVLCIWWCLRLSLFHLDVVQLSVVSRVTYTYLARSVARFHYTRSLHKKMSCTVCTDVRWYV